MRQVLLTGFEEFGSLKGNSSWEAVGSAQGRIQGARVEAVQLPVSYSRASAELEKAIESFGPDLVVATGQAQGRTSLNIEYWAKNLADADVPDNDHYAATGETLEPDAPYLYFTTLPVRACLEASRMAGVPAAGSESAGTYVCNTVFYRLMHLTATRYPHLMCGFVHLPPTPAQSLDGEYPTLPTDMAADALAAIVEAALLGGGRSVSSSVERR